MENEKIIFLDPEDELNEVHERLKNTNAGHVILVVPPQTQLQHLVEWRLLHKWVRDLPQDVQINSYDQQIRAKAKAAGFRVAASLESPPSESPRLINRPVRRDTSGKLSHGTNKQRNIGSRASRSLRSGQPQMPLPASENSSTLSSSGDMNREFDSAASSTFEIEDIPYDSHDVPDNSHYALPIEPVSHTQSAAGDQEDGEFDSMAEDYYVARSIREAAQSFDSSVSSSNIDYTETASGKLHQSSEIPQPDQLEDDPFAYMEDIQPIALREQRASTFIHDLDQGIPDISDIPTEMHDVDLKNLSDEQESVIKHDWSSRTWNDHMLDVSGGQETSHIDSMSPLNSRMGNTMRPAFEDLEKEDDLIGLSDQQTRVPPLSPISSPGASTPSTARYEPQPILQPSRQTSKVSINSNVQQSKKPGATKKSRRVNTNPPSNVRASSNSNRNGKRNLLIVSISAGVLLLVFLAFLYFGSNATVTVVVSTNSLSAPGQEYVASINPKNGQQNAIPSQVLTFPTSLRGQGTATGTVQQGNQIASGTVSCPTALTNSASATGQGTTTGTTQQGNQFASGTVTFSNKGSNPLDIPTCTVLSTSGPVPVQFVTVADILVQPDTIANNIPSVAPVQAILPGAIGTVAANSITLIPPDSQRKIALNNQMNSLAPGILTVTNPNATSGVSATNVPSVSSSDASKLALKLYSQEQNDITAWLTKVKHQDDVAGRPVLLLSATPAVGQPAPDGTFTGVLSVKVLVIRNAAIQMEGRAQLTKKSKLMNPPSVLATQLPVTVNVTRSIPSQDGTTLSIMVDANGYRMQQVSAQQISQRLAGKSVDDAITSITNGQAGIQGYANIVHFPPFLNFMPFRAEQIQIVVQPEPNNITPKG